MHLHTSVAQHLILVVTLGAASVLLILLIAITIILRRRPTAEEREARRRNHLATHGRIVDGSLVDAEPSDRTPQAVIYRYRIAGVTYECSQDVSTLPSLVQNLKLDYPVQVRYNRANPADSIVVAENWNGLWTNLWSASGGRRAEMSEQR